MICRKHRLVLFLLFVTLCKNTAFAQTVTIDHFVQGTPVIDAAINGMPVRLELDLSGPRFVVLNGEAAVRVGVRANRLLRISATTEGHTMKGRTGRADIKLANVDPFRLRMMWFPERTYSTIADGKIGVGAFRGIEQLIINLKEGARDTAPTILRGKNAFEWSVPFQAHGMKFDVTFDLSNQHTIMEAYGLNQLASAGVVMNDMNSIELTPFKFHLKKPLRTEQNVSFRPFGLYPKTISSYLRQEDVQALQRRKKWRTEWDDAQDVIIVTPTKKKKKKTISMTIGRHALLQCTSVIYHYKTGEVSVFCPDVS